MNKKLLIAGCVLLLCCCFSTVIGFGLVGYLENSGQCVYRGPLSSVDSGACAKNNTSLNSVNSTTNNNSTDSNNNQPATSDTKTYEGANFSLDYPSEFIVDESSSDRLFVYAENETDNLNISSQVLRIDVNQTNCEDYALETMNDLVSYDAQLEDVSTTTLDGYNACRVDFTADYGLTTERVVQTQYYIEAGSDTYVMTITINSDFSNFNTLNNIAKSVRFN